MMLEELIQKLLVIYNQDLQDYQKIAEETDLFCKYLEIVDEGNHEKVSPTQKERLTEQLEGLTSYREDIVQRAKERATEAGMLQNMICKKTGMTSLDLSSLKSQIRGNLFSEFEDLTKRRSEALSNVLNMDTVLIPRLTMEVESVKLELHRIQSAKKTRKAYDNQGLGQAVFIDKNK